MNNVPRSVLLVTPHQDDAEGGCGGSVGKWTKYGTEAVYVLCTNGDKGSSDPAMTSPALAAIGKKNSKTPPAYWESRRLSSFDTPTVSWKTPWS